MLIRVNEDRLWDSLMAMAEIGATEHGGSCRLALSPEDLAGRRLFRHWCEEAGLEVYSDAIGNVFARRHGSNPDAPPVLCGSHLDTQPLGGRFDGVYGVLAGLEVMRTFNDHDIGTRHPLEVVVWMNEEGSRFTPGVMGSAVYAGRLDLAFARSRTCLDSGVTVGEELDKAGLSTPPPYPAQPKAYYEAHIEQGPLLEKADVPLGVVTGVQGLYEYDVELAGFGCHAGTTPMAVRRDALVCAARIIADLDTLARDADDAMRLTVGKILCHPNSPNTIPDGASFTIDMRHPDQAVLERMDASVSAICREHADKASIGLRFERVAANAPIVFHPDCVERVRQACRDLELPGMDMFSGAGHDAVNLSWITPSAMIFVPCKDGLSHNEAEYSSPAQLARGASVLANVLLAEAG